MELRLSYNELNDMIEKKTGHRLPIAYASTHTVRISYDVMLTQVGLDITIEEIKGRDIILSYNGGMGIDFMVKQALRMAKSRPGGELIEPLDNNRILLALGRASQVGSIFDHIDLKDIRFDEQYAIVDFIPKMQE